MRKTTFHIQQMDCAAEEQLIRFKLEGLPEIDSLSFDLPRRQLEVFHRGDHNPILEKIDSLGLGGSLLGSAEVAESPAGENTIEHKVLWAVLAINLAFFGLESAAGILADSMGLVADSLDMLADSLVYGLALLAVGGSLARKQSIARTTGVIQLALAVLGILEVLRRFLGVGETPVFQTMVIISALALVGNAVSLLLLQRGKSTETHIKAIMICTSNDVIVNLGVIIAGGLVYLSGSKIPDLAVGTIVFFIVARGAWRILQLAK